MDKVLTITQREQQEIYHAMFYVKMLNHGTVGHNMLVLIAKLAEDRGFVLDIASGDLELPDAVIVTEK